MHLPINEERRTLERYAARKGDLVFFNQIALGQLIDINMGGLSFSYIHRENNLSTGPGLGADGTIDLIVGASLYLAGLSVSVASNSNTGLISRHFGPVFKWRCSLKFNNVVNGQKFLLKRLVQRRS